MYKYVIDPTRTVGATDQTRDTGRTDGQMECNQYSPPPPTTSLCGGYKNGIKQQAETDAEYFIKLKNGGIKIISVLDYEYWYQFQSHVWFQVCHIF